MGEINLPLIYGELCELRGSMTARMEGVERQLETGLNEIRDAASEHTTTAATVAALEEAELQSRILALEGNWRLATWVGGAIGLLILGLAGETLRQYFFGGAG